MTSVGLYIKRGKVSVRTVTYVRTSVTVSVDSGGLAIHHHPYCWTFAQGVPLGRQNSEGCTKL